MSMWRDEPARVVAVVEAVAVLLVSLGVMTVEESAAWVGVAAAVIALVGGAVVRERVTPVDEE